MSDAPKLRLPLPLREADPAIVAAGWYRLRARTKPSMTRRWMPVVAFAAVVAIALLVVRGRRSVLELEPRGETSVLAESTPVRRDFKDGSWLELAPGARGTWSVPASDSVRIRLDIGRIALHVQPGGPRTWRVESGPTTTTVVGTDLVVERSSDRTSVRVDHGVVRVKHARANDEHPVRAGESVVVPDELASGRNIAPTAHPTEANAAVPIESLPTAAPTVSAKSPIGASTRWRALASEGRPREAMADLGDEGLKRETAQTEDAQTLLELADVARLGGKPALAVAPLERLIRLHPNDPSAALAAFTLGKLELDDLGRPEDAARSFAECIRLVPPRGIREDAYARRVLALGKSGHDDQAREAAREYRRLYPQGRHLADLARWLGND